MNFHSNRIAPCKSIFSVVIIIIIIIIIIIYLFESFSHQH